MVIIGSLVGAFVREHRVDGHHRVGQRFQRARGHAFVAARYFSCVKRHYDDVVT